MPPDFVVRLWDTATANLIAAVLWWGLGLVVLLFAGLALGAIGFLWKRALGTARPSAK
jgi:hypothetical protein